MPETRLRTPKATAQLREDHRRVKKLFRKWEKAGDEDAGRKAELFDEIKTELTIHAAVEEEIFYPAMERAEDERTRKLVREAYEEHRVVKTLLTELASLERADDAFDAKMKVLIENVEHHAEEEEKEMFPEFDELPREMQADVSERLRLRKGELGGE